MKKIYAGLGSSIDLGRQGESLARSVVFVEPAEWRAAYGDGTVQLVAQRYGESTVYPVALDTDGDAVVWHVTAADTALAGYGRCELRYLVDEVVVKSKTYLTLVAESMTGDEIDPPEPQQGWVDRVLLAGGDAQAAAEAAEAAAKRAEAVDVAGLDTTLTEEGKAADAKAVGEALKNAGAVKTVNGVEPDESGNVEVEVGGDPVQPDWSVNDETANDYIKNRTHYDSRKIETIEITWDGDTTGKTVVSLPMGFDACKVSDIVPTIDELVGGVCQTKKVSTGEGIAAITLDANQCGQIEDGCFYAADILVVTKAGIYFGTEFTEAGIYSPKDLSRDVFVSDLRYTANTGELKQIDMKYLPDPLQFGYKKTIWKDLGEVTVTSQPNTLPDGSTANFANLATEEEQELIANLQSHFTAGCTIPLVRVVFDGVEYELPVLDAAVVPEFIQGQGVAYVCGNLSLLKGILYDPALDIADTGEPFGLALTLGFMGTSETEPATHTVAVSAGTIEPVKVPEEYLPFYHAVDKVDLVNGTITTENQVADPDTPFYLSSYGQEAPLDRIPEKLTVVFDGVEYAELQGRRRFFDMVGTFIHFGNEAVEIPNGVGGELDTGEPFLIRLAPNWVEGKTMGLILYTNTPTGQTHSLVVSTIATHDLDIGGNARFGGTVEAQAVILTNPNGVRYSITVDQHGDLNAMEMP